MGYEEEAESLVVALFASSHQIPSDVITTAFLRLTRRILNSQPIGGADARWRVAMSTDSDFDFARGGGGDSRFAVKQQGMQRLGRRLWSQVAAEAEASCEGFEANRQWLDTSALLAVLFPPLAEESPRSPRHHHVLNALLAGAEVCECARALHTRWSRLKQSSLLRPVFRSTIDAAVSAGAVADPTAAHHALLSPEDLFFQTVTLVPHFIANLAEQLTQHAKSCLNAESTDPVDFVACAAQLLTVFFPSF